MRRIASIKGIFASFAKTCFEAAVGIWSAGRREKWHFLLVLLDFSSFLPIAHNPEVVGSSPASATKENTTQTGGVFFGYDSMLRSYHLLVVRPTSVARWVSEGSAADEATRAQCSGLYFQGGFARRRKYRVPQTGLQNR